MNYFIQGTVSGFDRLGSDSQFICKDFTYRKMINRLNKLIKNNFFLCDGIKIYSFGDIYNDRTYTIIKEYRLVKECGDVTLLDK